MDDQEIVELRRRVDEAHRVLSERRLNLKQALIARCRVKVGDIVRSNGKEYRVAEISDPEYGWVTGNPRKKDGSWGIAVKPLFGSFEVVS